MISDVLDKGMLTKMHKMSPQGFASDQAGKFECQTNEGWGKRRGHFLSSSKAVEDIFTSDAVTYMGALCTNFQGMDARKQTFVQGIYGGNSICHFTFQQFHQTQESNTI
jgi:hypothetical protein